MSDEPTNQHYRLRKAAERAREVADKSCDPLDHAVKNALSSVVVAEENAIARDAYLLNNGPLGQVSDLPPWSQATTPGYKPVPCP